MIITNFLHSFKIVPCHLCCRTTKSGYNNSNRLAQRLLLFGFILTTVFVQQYAYAQADLTWNGTRNSFITVDIKNDFDANPDDQNDDTWAFIKLAKWLSNKWDKDGIPYAAGGNMAHQIDYSQRYVIVNFPASINGGAYLVGKEMLVSNVNGNDYSYLNQAVYSGVTVPYKDIFPGKVNVLNTEGSPVTILQEFTNHAGTGTSTYSTVYWQSIANADIRGTNAVPLDGIWFKGEPNTVIKKNSGMHLGYWDKDGEIFPSPYNLPIANNIWYGGPPPTLNKHYANGYQNLQQNGGNHIFFIQNAKNIQFTDLEIDGNKQTHILGSFHPTESIQSGPIGIGLVNTKKISIVDLKIHHTAFDGIYLSDADISASPTEFECKNTELQYNGRTAFAWISGDGVNFDHVDFNYAGKNDPNTLSSYGNPNCGIDLEPDEPYEACLNGEFLNCNFIGNAGNAILNDLQVADRADNIKFYECTIFSDNEQGIRCTGTNFVFEKCSIYAPIIYSGNITGTATVGTKYKLCTFEDKPYNGVHWNHSHQLILIPGFGDIGEHMNKTIFEDCTFKVNDKDREFFYLNWLTSGLTKNEYTVIDNCRFIYNNAGKPLNTSSFMRGVLFKRKNSVTNILNAVNSHHAMITLEAALEGSTDACNPNTLTIEGQVEHIMLSTDRNVADIFDIGTASNNTDGYAQYTIEEGALTYLQSETTVDIGLNSFFHVKKGGSLLGTNAGGAGSALYLDGGFFAHEKSYLGFEGGRFLAANLQPASSILYIDKDCNKDGVTTSPLWCNGVGYGAAGFINPISQTYWYGNYSNAGLNNICIQGGHSVFAPLNVAPNCNPLYTGVLSSNSINLLYNKSVSCFGSGASTSFNFMIQGAANPYTCTVTDANNNTFTITSGTTYTDATTPAMPVGNYTITAGPPDIACPAVFDLNLDIPFEYKIDKGCVGGAPSFAKVIVNACTATMTGPTTPILAGTPPNAYFLVNTPGTYTISASSPAAGTVTKTVHIGDCSDCPNAPTDAEWYAPNVSSSSIHPDGIASVGPKVYQGEVNVDNSLFIYNNPNIYMAANAEMVLDDNVDPDVNYTSLVINKSQMKGCGAYWNGISADNATENVIINNGSVINNMSLGVRISNNAFIQATNSTFKNSWQNSIVLSDINTPYYYGIVENNDFFSDGDFINVGSCTRGITGISIKNGNYLKIGSYHYGNNVSLGNRFDNLYNGIYVYCTPSIGFIQVDGFNNIELHNNKFTNIQPSPGATGASILSEV